MSSYFRHWKRGRNKSSSSSSPSSSLLEQGNNNNNNDNTNTNTNTNTMENKQIYQTTSPRKEAVEEEEEEEVDKIVTTMINDKSKPPVVEEKPQEQKLQPHMEIPNTNTKTISTLEYDVQPKQLLDDNNSCQPLSSHLAQEQPIMTSVSTNNYSLAISPSTSQINDKFLLSPLKGKSQSKEASAEVKFGFKQRQTLHSSRINRVSSSQKSITLSNSNDLASPTQANNNNDNNNAMVPTVPQRDTVNVARRVSSLSLDLNKDGICVANSNATSLSDIINLVEESAMAKPLSIFEETDNSAAQSISTSTSTTTNNNSNNSDDIAVASSSPSSSSTKTKNSTNSLPLTSPYTKMKTVAEFSNNNNNSNITASFTTTNTNTCTKDAAAPINNNNLKKSSPPTAVQPRNKIKTSSIGIINNTCSTDLLEPDSATTTSTKNENDNNGMVILNSIGKTSMTGKEKNILRKKLTEQEPSIIRTRRPQSENVEGDESKYVSTPTSESNDNNFLIRQLKRLCSFNVPGGSEANGASLPERTKKAPQRLRQNNANLRSEENKNIKHMPVAHSTTTTTTTTSSPSTSKSSRKRRIEKQMPIAPSTTITTTTVSPSTSKSSRKRRIEKHIPAAAAPPPPPPTMRYTTTTTNCTPSTAKSSGIGRVEKSSQEAKCTATTTLPGRRRCMRCISNGAPTSQAIECPGGKGRSGKGACKFFLQKDTCIVAPHSIAGRRRCMLCIDNDAPTSQAIECSGGKGRSGKGACKFFLQEFKCVVALVSVAYQHKNGTVRKEFKRKINYRKSESKKDEGKPILASPSLGPTKHKTKPGKGKWTIEEHTRFLKAFHLFGTDWTKVAAMVKTRAVSKVQSYAHNSAFGHTLSNWSLNDYEQFLKKVPESWNLANNDHIIKKLRSKERTKDDLSTHASASCSISKSSSPHATSSEEGVKESTTNTTLSREAFHETIQDTAAQLAEIIVESKQETTPRFKFDFSPVKNINTSKTPVEMIGTKGKSSESNGNAPSCESGNSTRSASKSVTKMTNMTTEVNGTEGKPSASVGNAPNCKSGNSTSSASKSVTKMTNMTTEVNGTEGKPSASVGNAPNCESGNSTRSASESVTKMTNTTTEVNGTEGKPSESVGNAPRFENGNSTRSRSTSKSATKMTTDTTTEVNGIEGKSTDSIGNAPNCESGNSTRSTSKLATKMTTEVNETEGKPSESIGNAPSFENGSSTRSRSTSKSAIKMTTDTTIDVNGTGGKQSESIGNAPSFENGNSTRSTSKAATKMTSDTTTEVNGTEGKPSEPVGNAPRFENGNSTGSISKSATKMTTDMTTEVHGTKGKSTDSIGNAPSCESGNSTRSQICPATNNNGKDIVGDSNISIHSNMKSNAKVVKECQMCQNRREGRTRKIAHDAFCRHSRLYTGPDKIVRGKRKKSVVSSSRSSAKSSTVIDTEASTKPTKNEAGDSKYLYAVRELASFNEPPENEKHGTEIEVTAGGRIHPKRRRITCNFYEPRLMPDNKFRIMQEEQFGKDDNTKDNNDDGEDDIHNDPNSRTRKYTAMKSTKPKTECKACLFGSSYKMGHCVSCPRSRYYDPTATPASNYTEHQKNKKRGRAEVQLRATTTATTTGSCDDNFDSGNTTDPTSNKRKKKRKNKYDNDNMSISKKRKKSSSSKASSSSSRRRNSNNFTVSQDTTRRIITNALIRFQFQDRNHKIRKDHP